MLAGSNLTDAQKQRLAPLVSSVAGYFTSGGNPINVSFGGNVALSAVVNNYLFHHEAKRKANIEDQLAACTQKANCHDQLMRDLEAELASLKRLDQTRDLLARVVCQNAISTECLNAIQQVNAAVNSYNRANGGFDRFWEDNRSAGLLRDSLTAGPAWDPAAFGFGLAAGAALGLHTVLGAAAVREAVAICAGNPYCTAKVITKTVGEVVLADISGGAAIISTPGGKTVRVELSPSLRIPSTTASVAPNLTSRGTLINLYPADRVVMETTPRTLQLIDGRYWLITNSGQRLTPTGTINFVTLPNGTIRVATQNNISNYSTHLGLSKGGEVSYAGTITFPNGSSPNRGQIQFWTNASGHYQPPAELANNAGLPLSLFKPVEFH